MSSLGDEDGPIRNEFGALQSSASDKP